MNASRTRSSSDAINSSSNSGSDDFSGEVLLFRQQQIRRPAPRVCKRGHFRCYWYEREEEGRPDWKSYTGRAQPSAASLHFPATASGRPPPSTAFLLPTLHPSVSYLSVSVNDREASARSIHGVVKIDWLRLGFASSFAALHEGEERD